MSYSICTIYEHITAVLSYFYKFNVGVIILYQLGVGMQHTLYTIKISIKMRASHRRKFQTDHVQQRVSTYSTYTHVK